jgi:uncharacterized protein (TIGR02448 family)
MKTLVLAILILASSGAQAFFITTTPMSLPVSTTDATSGSDKKMVIHQAKDDAAAYVASEGQIQGPFLTRALELIRAENPSISASDAELANAIMATEN